MLVYPDVVPDPPEANVLDAVSLAKSENVSCVLGIGGGSPMDVAKLVAFLGNKNNKQGLADIYGVGLCRGNRLPLVQIPTTAGTGSEVTPISILTTGENEKKGIVSSQLLPDLAVLDGELTTSLPANITAYTGIDAMVHAIEAFTTKLKKNAVSDMLAKEALHLLGSNLRKVIENGADVNARSDMLLGSMMAGMAFANAPVGAVHALAYPLGSHFKVPHGLSNSLVLPHVLRFNAAEPHVAEMYAHLAPIVFPSLPPGSGSSLHLAEAFADSFAGLAEDLQLPMNLRQVGVAEGDLDMLCEAAMKQTRLLPNNPREVTAADARAIYQAAF